jgi:hypothetical protein
MVRTADVAHLGMDYPKRSNTRIHFYTESRGLSEDDIPNLVPRPPSIKATNCGRFVGKVKKENLPVYVHKFWMTEGARTNVENPSWGQSLVRSPFNYTDVSTVLNESKPAAQSPIPKRRLTLNVKQLKERASQSSQYPSSLNSKARTSKRKKEDDQKKSKNNNNNKTFKP